MEDEADYFSSYWQDLIRNYWNSNVITIHELRKMGFIDTENENKLSFSESKFPIQQLSAEHACISV